MTNALIDEIIRDVQEYEKTSMGVKFGEDFPTFAAELLRSERFRALAVQANMMSLLSALSLSREPKEGEDARGKLESGPMREIIAEALYIGFRLGKRELEVGMLERMSERK